jgi:hypothetical protein
VSTGANDKTARQEREPFLHRWSRRKQEATRDADTGQPAEKPPTAAADSKTPPELPPVEKLDFDSDYRAFFHPKVGEDTRRAALKRLFSDARFNIMDGLDVYIDDYSKSEPIPPAMLAGLQQAQNILQWARGEEKEAPADRTRPEAIDTRQTTALEPPAASAPPAPTAERSAESTASVPDGTSGSRSSGNA